MRCPKYIWQDLTQSGRGWTYNEYPSVHTRQRATALRAEFEIDDALETPYFFYDNNRTFRVYWYTENTNSSKELHYKFRWFEFDYDGKRTGVSSGSGGGFENVDPEYWLHKEGYP